MSFEDIVAPLGLSDFVANYWNSQFCRVSGPAGRFSSLIAWPTLSAILEQDFLVPPRLRLIQDGKGVPPERYLAPLRSGTQLNATGLLACLSEGATLIIDSLDRLVPPIGAVAEAFEQALRLSTPVWMFDLRERLNLLAYVSKGVQSWRSRRNFANGTRLHLVLHTQRQRRDAPFAARSDRAVRV